ncbi:MAG TPA: hypothetical protein VFD82_12845 [Planctomycetota bacterium]|nr:hypothetical protein [Planctomycetota bacterium]
MRTTSSLLLLGAALAAQAPPPSPTFGEPVRLKAGDKFLGENRWFPSPVFQDMNGDGRADVVVGDLAGHLTIALREASDGPPAYAAETKQMALDGKLLDFHNW